MKAFVCNIFALLVLLLIGFQLKAQNTSNKGTDFWVAYAGHVDGLTSRMTLFLSSDVSTPYKVIANGVIISQGNIIANVVTPVFVDPNRFDVYVGSSDLKEVNKAIKVSTDKPISLYCVISNNARTGSSLILPTSALEQEYYVFSEQNMGATNADVYSQFTIVGTKDGTTVEITPTKPSADGTRNANEAFQVTLNQGDIYQYQAVDDLTGSHVKSLTGCAPLAVFSGNTWAAYCELGNPRKANGGDNIYQQLFPVTAWGKNFVVAPFYNTLNGNTDVVKIIVAEDNTTVSINGSLTGASGTVLSNPYAKGSVITYYTNKPSIIKASSGIAVAQFQTSQNCNFSNSEIAGNGGPFLGDPEMTVLNPIEQTLKDITVYSRLNSVSGVSTNIKQYYLNIILKTSDAAGFKLDGNSILTQFKPITDSEYSYAVVNVTNTSDQHRLIGTGGFIALAYGYGQVESYAYLAGTDLKNLKSNIQAFASGSSVASSNFCLGSDFDFVLKLPYLTEKVTWNLNNGAFINVSDQPSYTNVIEDGVNYYLYRYALPSVNFSNPGNYSLKATIQKPVNAFCAEDESVLSSFDVFSPAIDAPLQACVNTDVRFNDGSPSTGGNIKSWLWDFGDELTASDQNPLHKFSTPGQKAVKLTVITDLGCTLTTIKNIDILASPKSDFNAIGPFCINANIQFANNTTAVNSVIASQVWDFGNGQTSNLSAPITTYTSSGVYTVKLISISAAGCADTVSKSLTIYDLPEVSFKDPGVCVSDQVSFESTAVKGQINNWSWDFGDGSQLSAENTKQNPNHKYDVPGEYLVKLTVTSDKGCNVVFSREIKVSGPNPAPSFSLVTTGNLCANNVVTFQNNSTIVLGEIRKLEWIFDHENGASPVVITDSEPTLGKLYQHQYPNLPVSTNYSVVLRAYSGNSCFVDSDPMTITIHPAPILSVMTVEPLCEIGDPVQISMTDQNNVTGTLVFSGKGVSSSGLFDPRISGSGNFNVKAIFTSNMGCVEEKNINILVNKLPDFSVPDEVNILLGGQRQIAATLNSENTTVKWSPANGLSATDIINPVVNVDRTTVYTVTTTLGSCVVEKQVQVNVHENPTIPNVFSPNGDGKNDTWNIKYLDSYVNGKISIFNRYGQLVFSAKPYQTPWNGKFNGAELPLGVYYYVIEPNNGRKKYTGSVTILR